MSLLGQVVQDRLAGGRFLTFAALATYRIGHLAHLRRGTPSGQILAVLHGAGVLLFHKLLGSCEIPAQAVIGERIQLPHGTNGVIIGTSVEIGSRCVLYHQVTIGTDFAGGKSGAPRLGDDVVVGAGAKILGPVAVGDGARIGANAVVISDVAPHTTVGGVPARRLGTTSGGDMS